jgi:hypothetical protein
MGVFTDKTIGENFDIAGMIYCGDETPIRRRIVPTKARSLRGLPEEEMIPSIPPSTSDDRGHTRR